MSTSNDTAMTVERLCLGLNIWLLHFTDTDKSRNGVLEMHKHLL